MKMSKKIKRGHGLFSSTITGFAWKELRENMKNLSG
jgi:hypothetical protein